MPDALGYRPPARWSRAGRMAWMIFLAALVFYGLTASYAPVPGDSALAIVNHTSVGALRVGTQPWWGFVARGVTALPGALSPAARLTVLSILCAAAALSGVFRLLHRQRLHGDATTIWRWGRLTLALSGVLYLAVTVPMWQAATRAGPPAFDALLFVTALLLLQRFARGGAFDHAIFFGLLCGVGFAESTLFVLASPFLALAFLWHVVRRRRRRWGALAGALAGAALGALALLMPAYQLWKHPTASWFGVASLGEAWWIMATAPAKVVYYAPHTGWLLIALLVATPFAMVLRWVRRPKPEGTQMAWPVVGWCLAVVLALPLPLAPWRIQGERGLSMLAMLMLAEVFAVSTATLVILFFNERRRAGLRTAWVTLLVVALTTAICGWMGRSHVMGRSAHAMNRVVRDMRRAFEDRRYLVTHGLVDDLWAASGRRSPVMINTDLFRYGFYRRYLESVTPDARLKSLAAVSPAGLIREWPRLRPEDRLAVTLTPVSLGEEGLSFEPDRGLYAAPDEQEDLSEWLDRQAPFWLAVAQLRRWGEAEDQRAAKRLAAALSRSINDSGVRLDRAGMTNEALRAYRAALEARPEQLSATVNLFGLLEAAQADPEERAKWRASAEALLASHTNQEALVAAFQRDGRLRAANALEIFQHAEETASDEDAQAVKAVMDALRMGRVDLALALCREGIDRPDTPVGLWILSGMVAEQAGDSVLLARCLHEMEAREAGWHSLRMVAARKAWRQGDRDEALRHVRLALDAAPNNPQALELFLKVSTPEAGEAELHEKVERLLAVDPANKTANLLVGQWMMNRGAFDVAEGAYRAVLSSEMHPVALNNLAYILLLRDRPSDALPYIQSALAVRPQSAALWDTLGQVYLGLNDGVGADRAFEHALTIDPEHLEARLGRALAWAWLGKRDEAAAEIEVLRPRLPMGSARLLEALRNAGLE